MTGLFEGTQQPIVNPKWYVVYRRNEGQWEANESNRRNSMAGAGPALTRYDGTEGDIAKFNTKKEAFEFSRMLASQQEILDGMGVVFAGRYTYQVKAMRS